MQTKIVKKDVLKVIGKELRTNNHKQHEITQFWQKFENKKIIKKIQHQIQQGVIIAVYTDYANDHTGDYTLVLGAPVNTIEKVPEKMVGLEIPSAHYAVITTRGPIPESIIKAWQYIWSDQFAHERTFANDFELYELQRLQAEIPEVDIYVGIKVETTYQYE